MKTLNHNPLLTKMENPDARPESRRRERSKERSEGPAYKDVSTKAVYKEADLKADAGPAVSMTVVGETVTFTQHFHF